MKNDFDIVDATKMVFLTIILPVWFIWIMFFNVTSLAFLIYSNTVDIYIFVGFCIFVLIIALFKYRYTVTKKELYKIYYILGYIAITIIIVSHLLAYIFFYNA